MIVRFAPTRDEMLAFQRHFIKTDPASVRARKKIVWGAAIIYIGVGLLIAYGNSILFQQITAIVLFTVIAVLWLIFSPRYILSASMKRVEQRLSEKENAMFFAEREITFSQESIRTITEDGEETFRWKAMIKLVETKDSYYLYNSAITALILPIRVFTEKQDEELRTLFALHHLL